MLDALVAMLLVLVFIFPRLEEMLLTLVEIPDALVEILPALEDISVAKAPLIASLWVWAEPDRLLTFKADAWDCDCLLIWAEPLRLDKAASLAYVLSKLDIADVLVAMSAAKADLIASLLTSAEEDKADIDDTLAAMLLMLVFILPKLLDILPTLVAIPEALVAILLTFEEIPDALVAMLLTLVAIPDVFVVTLPSTVLISDARAPLIASLFTSAEEDKEVNCPSLA